MTVCRILSDRAITVLLPSLAHLPHLSIFRKWNSDNAHIGARLGAH